MATTPYNFVTPIRYYKANDPYYYEVDNIPLRQLEENILYVKDKITTKAEVGGEISIYDIKELRPKVEGGRTIKVNAGRFVSRINDAYSRNKPLASLIRESPYPVLPDILPTLSQELWTQEKNDAVWDAFTGPLAAANAYNTNGLETFFTFYSTPSYDGVGSSWGVKPVGDRRPDRITPGGNNPWYAGQSAAWQNLWPQIVGNWNKYLSAHPHLGNSIGWGGGAGNGVPALHVLFTQMWRGIFRTAVVDVPESTIEIPPFADEDFRYWDDNPNTGGKAKIIAGATHRIDLLVAYSMPIDSSSTTIVDYIANTNPGGILPPTSTTKPMLGLVMGAGVGILKSTLRQPNSRPIGIEANDFGNQDALGHKKIVGNVSDQDPLANAGITDINGNKVHGSFPSPDDLLNVAPILALNIGGDSAQDLLDQLQLIGQAALPLAYIVVKKDQPAIVQDDIIDIRPFLRTTEFTYNERAGVAAANPPLSLANPAVGAYQLQHVIDKLQEGGSGGGSGGASAGNSGGVALYTDYVMGGLAYGVEGTMLTMCDGVQGVDDPFGSTTKGTIYKSQGNLTDYNFSGLTSSKKFMEESDENLKKAYLEWVFNNRQSYLKVWLSNPNNTYSKNRGTYLGLPVGTEGRNIPLYPEWDMPVSRPQYPWMIGRTDPNQAGDRIGGYSPDPSFWMWMETQSPFRQMMYAPGGVAYTYDENMGGHYNGSIINKGVGFGWGKYYNTKTKHQSVGFGDIIANKKTLTVQFPGWVKSYDVIANYSNCSPIIGTTMDMGDDRASSYGMGLGLGVDSGMIGATANNTAIITITSYSSGKPNDQWAGQGEYPNLRQVKTTKDSAQRFEAPGPVVSDNPAQWMMYSVCLPQLIQTKFGTLPQKEGNKSNHRLMPKIGGAMYPTVKFTIIGYDKDPIESNKTYSAGGLAGKTMSYAPDIGTATNLTGQMPPWQEETIINIS